MGEREIVKEYVKGDLTVVWKPKLCIHSAICVKTLPQVYDPEDKPWIKPENASMSELKDQIEKCPSAALSYRIKDEKRPVSVGEGATKVEVSQNGPLLVHGELEITDADGNKESRKRTTAFCRCGASNNKPYCDGAHNEVGFEG